MRKVVSVALSLLLLPPFAGLASATDLDWRNEPSMKDEPPILVPRYVFSWTGFYLGGHFGYSWGDSSFSSVDGDPFDGEADGFVVQPDGWIGGFQVGYNWQIDNFLFGLEGDLGVIDAEDEQHTSNAFVKTEYGNYGTITARLGFIQNRWLFYAKGGLALADIETRAGAVAGAFPVLGDLTDMDDTRAGYAVGGGAEYAFHPNWSMKFEYLYMDFGEDGSGNIDGDTFHNDNNIHTVKVGINYRFAPVPRPPLR